MTVDFGLARAIDAHAYGEPGQRTFQLRILGANEESAFLWLEKQQVQALHLALTQVLGRLGRRPSPLEHEDLPDAASDYEFKVGQMAVGFDPGDSSVTLQMFDVARGLEVNDPDIVVRISDQSCVTLQAKLEEIIAAGRPVCVLCGLPLDPGGHACVRSNGHSTQPIPEESEED